jgi:hypothetical protein
MRESLTTHEAIFRRKHERRQELASLSPEVKVKMLIQLQHLASQVAHETGRPCKKPWGQFDEHAKL